MPQFNIRQYTETDISSIIYLFRLSFQKEISEQWFRWKYRNSPLGAKGYVAADGDKVIAFYGGLKQQFSFHGKSFWAYQFCDVMTHPDYRGKMVSKTPLIVQLGEMFYRENPMDFAFGFPSLRHARLQSLRLKGEGYRLVRLYWKEKPERHSVLWRLKVREGWESFSPSPVTESSCGSKLQGEGRAVLKLIKDEKYIHWRYMEHPDQKYRFIEFRRMNRKKGCIVFSIDGDNLNILEIFFARAKDIRDILIALEDHIVKEMPDVKKIQMWLHPNDPLAAYLKGLDCSSEDHIPIAFRPVNAESGITSDVFYNRFFYNMGDYDAS